MKSLASIGSSGRSSTDDNNINDDHDEVSKLAIASFQAREEEIERKKMEMRMKVESQLTRAEEETKRLAQIWEELEVLTDPMRKEVASVRKRIDMANRDLKSLGQTCQKKEREYKEALEALHEKNNEKTQLTTTLMQLVNESEKFRMRKLEELAKIVNPNT
ncbi:uncharacterized protein LOC111365517 [Olea europaea var. sylvestris]|uniref:uncharacterized protein LOC111365517 n=1 Tax=Olea europaea var. sylvestris TaxID=158386 RepID=UPI000C1D03CD|nr:uncharacterized protein LOC111365517 [Olea europaea var. sylvestris]